MRQRLRAQRRTTRVESTLAGSRCGVVACEVVGEGEGEGDCVRGGLNWGPSKRLRYSFTLADDDLRFSSRPILRHSSATWSERRRNSAIFIVSWWDELGERRRGSVAAAAAGSAFRRPAANSVDE